MASRCSSSDTPQDREKHMLLEDSHDIPSWSPIPKVKRQDSTIRLLVAWLGLLSFLSGSLVIYVFFQPHGSSSPDKQANLAPIIPPVANRLPKLTVATGPPLLSKDSPPLSCGVNVEEAKAAGCIFDVMSFHWVPPLCYDEAITEGFLAAREWRFYSKYRGNASDEIPLSEIQRGHVSAFVPWEYHPVHCTFQWRKMHRAFAAGNPLDSALANYNHTLHCEEMLWRGEWHGRWEVNTKVERKFVSCGYWY